MGTDITYNGSLIKTIESGKTATFSCKGTKAKTNVSILFGSKGSITYKGKTTDIEAGKTANLLCAGKKFATDVVAAVESGVKPYLTFSSPNAFTLQVRNNTKSWEGTLEYSVDANTWNIWGGVTPLSADNGKLYLRGTGNTKIMGSSGNDNRWELTGSNISCDGNIENLLDYATVANGKSPRMADFCYANMFLGCKNLVTAPKLPATTLANCCYYNMFTDCESLVTAPELPATTLARMCYGYMFTNCKNLTTVPKLPATTLANYCYECMFMGCSLFKISTEQTEEYTTPYRIPASGTGTTATSPLYMMFTNTGGTFTGTPVINTTYYTSNTVV